MTDDEFWTLIESTTPSEDGCTALIAELSSLTERDLVEFSVFLDRLAAESYRWSLWGAAYLIRGGCSDDGFDYFRAWLVAQGRTTYAEALRDPDSLAALPALDEDCELEDLLSSPARAYAAKTGEPSDAFYEVLKANGTYYSQLPESLGEGWDFDDETEMLTRYPRLAVLFLNED